MLRFFVLLIVTPIAVVLVWLALAAAAPRADFVAASEEPRTIDPHRVSLLAEIQIAAALFEGLTRLNDNTLQPEPAVAERWEYDAASLTYTFHLREGARWSNGAPVVAEQFRYAWLRVLDPGLTAQYYALLFTIRGAEAYYTSRTNSDPADDTSADSVAIMVDDPHTLRVTLARPCSYFLDLTSFSTFFPVYPPVIERWREPDGRIPQRDRHQWTRPGHIVGNGPFVLTAWEFKKHLLMEQNRYYWERAALGVKTLEVQVAGDANSSLLAYETGRVDLVRTISNTTARALFAKQQAGQRPDFFAGQRFCTFFFRVNCKRPPFDNLDLRKALWLAIDREELAANVMGMGETPAYTYVPRGSISAMPRTAPDGRTVYYQPPDGLGAGLTTAQREELAREYLKKSGFDRITPPRPIELTYAANPDYQRVAESVQRKWERVLGVTVTLRTLEAKVLSSAVRRLDYDLVRADWYGDYMDPSTFLDMFMTENGQNRTGWSNAEYDRLIAAAANEQDNERRFALFSQAERILCEEQTPVIPLFFRSGVMLLNPKFEGLHDNVREWLPIHRVRRVAKP